jgi:hypothetical protein
VSLTIAQAGESAFDCRASAAVVAERDFVPDAAWFAERREPFGDEAIRLEVGPLEFRLEGLSGSQAKRLQAQYGAFVRPGPERQELTDLTVRLRRAGVERFLGLPTDGRAEHYRMGRRTRDGRHDFWAYEFAASAEAGYTLAELALVCDAGPEFDRGVENVLRVLTGHTVLAQGGLLLHGAGVVRAGRAHLFFGPSGAGKTTVTDLSPRDRVLSDDLTLVLRTSEGYVACGHPFGMAHHRVPNTTASFPIAGLYRLVQAPEIRLQALDRSRALGEVASCLPFVMHDAAVAAQALDNAAAFLRDTPAWRLAFRKDDAFWGAIEERETR